MPINSQLPEPRVTWDAGSTLEVHSIFHTIQGEGPFSGMPAVFIRLAGCNLQCPGCDTEYTQGREATGLTELLHKVSQAWPIVVGSTIYDRPRLHVITGGEPLRQNISELCTALLADGHMVQIETNGTFQPPPLFPPPGKVRIVCSPKAGRVAPGLFPYITAYKYVLEAGDMGRDGLPNSILGKPGAPPARPHDGFKGCIYVSPMDCGDLAGNLRNTQATVRACLTRGFTLNLQIHKLVNLP